MRTGDAACIGFAQLWVHRSFAHPSACNSSVLTILSTTAARLQTPAENIAARWLCQRLTCPLASRPDQQLGIQGFEVTQPANRSLAFQIALVPCLKPVFTEIAAGLQRRGSR